MDKDKNASLDYNEFVEGSKKDPTIVQVRCLGLEPGFPPDLLLTLHFLSGPFALRRTRLRQYSKALISPSHCSFSFTHITAICDRGRSLPLHFTPMPF